VTDGSETNGDVMDGTLTDGSETDGTVTDGSVTDGKDTDGRLSPGTVTDDGEADGDVIEGTLTDGSETDGSDTDGTVTDGSVIDGEDTAGRLSPGTETTGRAGILAADGLASGDGDEWAGSSDGSDAVGILTAGIATVGRAIDDGTVSTEGRVTTAFELVAAAVVAGDPVVPVDTAVEILLGNGPVTSGMSEGVLAGGGVATTDVACDTIAVTA
jgi:hypothetical protein